MLSRQNTRKALPGQVSPEVIEKAILDTLQASPGKSVTAEGYDGLLKTFSLTGKTSITKFRKTLGRLSFTDRKVCVTYSELQGLNDTEPRDITVSLKLQK